MSALSSLDYHDIDELKSYYKPPVGVQLVTDVLCFMFDVPQQYVLYHFPITLLGKNLDRGHP